MHALEYFPWLSEDESELVLLEKVSLHYHLTLHISIHAITGDNGVPEDGFILAGGHCSLRLVFRDSGSVHKIRIITRTSGNGSKNI